MKISNLFRRQQSFALVVVLSAVPLGCSAASDAGQQDRAETTTAAPPDVGVDIERLYRMYFTDPESFEPADVEFEIDMALRGYRAASECMAESGRDYKIPSRSSIRNTLYSAQVVDARQNASSSTDVVDEGDGEGEPAGGAAVLTAECAEVQTAERDRIEAALEPYMEPLFDAFAAVDSDPRVANAHQAWADCMTEAGFRYPSRIEYLDAVDAMDEGPEKDGLSAADKACYAEPAKQIKAVQDETSQKFDEEYRVAILETLENLGLS